MIKGSLLKKGIGSVHMGEGNTVHMGVCRRRGQDLCIWEFVGEGNTVHMGVCRRREHCAYGSL